MSLKDTTVLIVDDEPGLRSIFGRWFERVARRVLLAENGAEALQILDGNKVDVIVADLRMPVMDGIGMLQGIKKRGPYMPAVIFISGFADLDIREVYDLGAEALLEKPVRRDELIRAVQRSVAGRDELWREPGEANGASSLSGSFASMERALEERRIAFGHGGFCIQTQQPLPLDTVNIRIEFKEDHYVLSGQGKVRWLAPAEGRAGIELTHVDDESRARAVQLAEASHSFIPRC